MGQQYDELDICCQELLEKYDLLKKKGQAMEADVAFVGPEAFHSSFDDD